MPAGVRRRDEPPAAAHRCGAAAWLALLLALGACEPALNWREFKVGDLSLTLGMPCRPSSHARDVTLAGRQLAMTLYACQAAGRTFAIGTLDAGDPAQVGEALSALAAAAVVNVQGRVEADVPADVPGMTPHPAARRLSIVGRSPDGRLLRSRVVLFSLGTRVVQATVLGQDADEDAERTFFESIKVVQ